MNSERGFKRIVTVLAVPLSIVCALLIVQMIIDKHEHEVDKSNMPGFDVRLIPENYSGNKILFEMIVEGIDTDRWRYMSEHERIVTVRTYNKKKRKELETNRFWVQLSKPTLVELCIAGGLAGALAGFSGARLVLWFGGLAICKLIRWLILGFYNDESSKQVEKMEAR